MEKRHIVCFGDSNTHGYRASDDPSLEIIFSGNW